MTPACAMRDSLGHVRNADTFLFFKRNEAIFSHHQAFSTLTIEAKRKNYGIF